MKNRDFVIIGLVAIVGFFIGVFFFSGNSESGGNIISSSNECEWENIYQGSYGSASVYRDITAGSELRKGGFVTPLGISYEEVEFKALGVIATTTERDNRFSLNNVDCGVMKKDIFTLSDFSTTCLNALKEGFNSFNSSKKEVIIHEIYVGMKYKPANCYQ